MRLILALITFCFAGNLGSQGLAILTLTNDSTKEAYVVKETSSKIIIVNEMNNEVKIDRNALKSIMYIDRVSLKTNGYDYEYQEVIEFPGQTKDQLFISANIWIVNHYKDANAVIQLTDKESGKIMLKGHWSLSIPDFIIDRSLNINHTTTIEIKDNKLRFTINSFEYEDAYNRNHGPLKELGEKSMTEVIKKLERLIYRYSYSIRTNILKAQSSDKW